MFQSAGGRASGRRVAGGRAGGARAADLISQSGGSDFLAESTLPLILVDKRIVYLVRLQTLLQVKCMG